MDRSSWTKNCTPSCASRRRPKTFRPRFRCASAKETLDYDFTKIGDSEFFLPLLADVRMHAGRMWTKNVKEFRLYRKFSADAVIKFEAKDLPPLPDDKTKEQPPQPQPRTAEVSFGSGFQFQKEKIAPWITPRYTVGFALPPLAGSALGHVRRGIIATIGELNVSYSDSHDPYVQRARRMLAASLLVGMAVFAGAHCAAITTESPYWRPGPGRSPPACW